MSTTSAQRNASLVVRSKPAYAAVRSFLVGYLGLLHRFEVRGVENLPREGGALIVANHQSMIDIPAIAVAAPRHLAFVARASLARCRGSPG